MLIKASKLNQAQVWKAKDNITLYKVQTPTECEEYVN